MGSLVSQIMTLLEIDLPSARRLANSETWSGPRADAVATNFGILESRVREALEHALRAK